MGPQLTVEEFLKNRPTFWGQISVPFFGTGFRPFKNSDKIAYLSEGINHSLQTGKV